MRYGDHVAGLDPPRSSGDLRRLDSNICHRGIWLSRRGEIIMNVHQCMKLKHARRYHYICPTHVSPASRVVVAVLLARFSRTPILNFVFSHIDFILTLITFSLALTPFARDVRSIHTLTHLRNVAATFNIHHHPLLSVPYPAADVHSTLTQPQTRTSSAAPCCPSSFC